MIRLREQRPVWFAVLWIAIHTVAVNAGDAFSATLGVFRLVIAPLVAASSIGLLLYHCAA